MICTLWAYRRYVFFITVALIATCTWSLIVASLLSRRADKLTDSVYTLKLVRGYYLDYHASIHTIALACPGVDYISLWSLPVVQSWEEPTDKPEFWAVWYPRRPDPVTIGGIFGFKDLRSSFV